MNQKAIIAIENKKLLKNIKNNNLKFVTYSSIDKTTAIPKL